MKALLLAHAKALTALVATLLLLVVHRLGLQLEDGTVMSVSVLAVALLVYAVPNTPPASQTSGGAPADPPTKPYGLERRRLTLRELAAVSLLALCGCAGGYQGPTQAEVGATVTDCTHCVKEVAPIVQGIFARCGAAADGGADGSR